MLSATVTVTATMLAATPVIIAATPAIAQGDSMTDFATGVVEANGVTFHYLEAGTGPLVLALHGFPDTARSYRHQLPALAAAGYRVVAPFMRGYAPTEIPEGATSACRPWPPMRSPWRAH